MKLPQFNFNSGQHMSLLLFGGTLEIEAIEPIKNEDGTFKLIKNGKNKDQIKVKKVKKEVYIQGLGIQPLKSWKTKIEGRYMTNHNVLQFIAQNKEV